MLSHLMNNRNLIVGENDNILIVDSAEDLRVSTRDSTSMDHEVSFRKGSNLIITFDSGHQELL